MSKKPPSADQPLYEVVRGGILEKLRTGHWQAGDRLPAEPQLAEAFGVGIGTVRRAVDELVSERLLHRRAGRGTTVATIADDQAFGMFFSFVDAAGLPLKPEVRLLAFEHERAGALQATRLGLERGARLARVDNLREAGGRPVMLDRLWIPQHLFPGLDAEGFVARSGPIYGHYQKRFGISVVRIAEVLGAVAAEGDVAEALQLAAGTPVLRIERTAFSFQHRPVEFRYRYVNPSLAQYTNSRGLQEA